MFIKVGTHVFRIVYGFDRVTIWFDRSHLPVPLTLLSRYCRDLKIEVRQMRKNPLWKLKMEVFQPSPRFFKQLLEHLHGMRVLITYIEPARDILPSDPEDLDELERACLASVTFPRAHFPKVGVYKKTYYFNRAKKGGKKTRDIPVMYADRSSKQPRRDVEVRRKIRHETDPKCLHQEWRRHGSAAIGEFGISSIADLQAFDFSAFFERQMPFRKLPSSQTELGGLLPGKRHVTDDSKRKRARQFMAAATLKNGRFILHNAIRTAHPKFAAKLAPMTLEEWLQNTFSGKPGAD
ncbi:hypothetical protein RCH10_001220 [Variovorax sp. GrIS 2.14]|uniref:hypothetical protein n=1 Tax=Variovorax sp. GrIS 2.14 TaxID=3071709 RepID=UPI0038F73F42